MWPFKTKQPVLDNTPKSSESITAEDYYRAAMRVVLDNVPRLTELSASWGGSESQLVTCRAAITKMRAFADKQTDRRYRSEIHGWLDWAELGADEYERELRTGAHRKHMQKYRDELDARAARDGELRNRFPRPEP